MAPGRRETDIGAHVEGHNRGTIGICLLGGYGASADDPFVKKLLGKDSPEELAKRVVKGTKLKDVKLRKAV